MSGSNDLKNVTPDAILKLGRHIGEPLQRDLEFGIIMAARNVEKLIAGQHQLRHHRHQLLDGVDADADRFVGDSRIGPIFVVDFGLGLLDLGLGWRFDLSLNFWLGRRRNGGR